MEAAVCDRQFNVLRVVAVARRRRDARNRPALRPVGASTVRPGGIGEPVFRRADRGIAWTALPERRFRCGEASAALSGGRTLEVDLPDDSSELLRLQGSAGSVPGERPVDHVEEHQDEVP